MNNDWISVKDDLPDNDDLWVLFVQWKPEWNTVIGEYYNTWGNVKAWREFDLKNNYTHWKPIQPPQTKEG